MMMYFWEDGTIQKDEAQEKAFAQFSREKKVYFPGTKNMMLPIKIRYWY